MSGGGVLEGVRGPNTAESKRRAVSSRKIACQICRQRKKKCDGGTPSCSGCLKLKAVCQYDEQHQQQAIAAASSAPFSFASWATSPAITTPGAANEDDGGAAWDWAMGLGTPAFTPSSSRPRDMSATMTNSHVTPSNSPDHGPWADMNMAALGMDNMLFLGMDFDQLDPLKQPLHAAMSPSTFPSLGLASPQVMPLDNGASSLMTPNSKNATTPLPALSETVPVDVPLQSVFKELLDIFFQQYHPLLPCIHQQDFLRRLDDNSLDFENDALPYAIASIAARSHWNPAFVQSSSVWLATASTLFDSSVKTLAYPVHTLAASVWIVFHLFLNARMSEMWIFLGKACRLASLLGLDRIDAKGPVSPFASPPQSPLEEEQRRQVVWALYLLDRLLSALCGWPLALDDRQFMVNFPREDADFQKCNFNSESEPFTTDLSVLVRPSSAPQCPKHAPMTMIRKTCVLLGRILIHHNTIHAVEGSSRTSEFASLEDALGRFCLTCSRDARSMWNVRQENLDLAIWLEVTLQMCTVLLYHPTATACSAASSPADQPTKHSSRDGDHDSSNNAGFNRCLHATHNTILLVRETAGRSVKALLNPFLVPAYFLSCRFLTIGWHEQNDAKYRQDLEVMLMLVDRAVQVWGPLGIKYKTSILHDIERSREEALRLRVGTGSYLSDECAS